MTGTSITNGCKGSGGRIGCSGPWLAGASGQGFPRELLRAEYPHYVWAIDFQIDPTMDGRTLKFLNVIDEYSRLCLAIRVGRRCRAAEVIDTIEELLKLYPSPTHLRWTIALNSSLMPFRSGALEVAAALPPSQG